MTTRAAMPRPAAPQRRLVRRVWTAGAWQEGARDLPEEVPVALSYNGTTQAVMMATPADLADFGLGFSVTEGIARPEEITELEVVALEDGFDVQMSLVAVAEARLAGRRRRMLGPVGCGLCGIDSIAAALRPCPGVGHGLRLRPAEIPQAMAALGAAQVLHGATRAVHAAGLWVPGEGLVLLREDVGRHNALDKLAGAMARGGAAAAARGAVVLSSRVSLDLVQKAAAMGVEAIIAASAPTARAVEEAERAGLTLVARAHAGGFELYAGHARLEE